MTTRSDRSRSPRLGAWFEGGGARFRQWAPAHERLELVLFDDDGRTVRGGFDLQREAGGFFAVTLPDAPDRLVYGCRIDGEGPFPDPHSRSQPFGVHGPSELRRDAFAWTDAAWRGVPRERLVVYELHVGTFTREGTFDAAIAHLADVAALGATAIELMPVWSFPGTRNWGYDGVQPNAPAHAYGGPDGLRRLVDAAHARGLAVLLDVVWNHFGPDGNYLWAYSRDYFTPRHATPWGDAVNFDAAPMRRMALDNAELWIREFHVDGLRLDATHAVFDDGEPHILRELADACRAAAPDRQVLVIAEDERNEARLVRPVASGGFGLDGVWADDFHHGMRRALAGDSEGYFEDFTGSTEELAKTVRQGWLYTGQPSRHHGRVRGTDPWDVPLAAFVHCLQNHDQIGNRALGDRLGAAVDVAAYRAASAILLLSPSTPLLFMGQEWNASTPFLYFTDHEPKLGRAVTEGRRAEFKAFTTFAGAEVPDPQAEETFRRSKLDWGERDRAPHAGVLAWYRDLLALRRTHPALQSADRDGVRTWAVDADTLALERRSGEHVVLVIARWRGAGTARLEGACGLLLSSDEARYGGMGAAVAVEDGAIRFRGPAAVVLERW